MGFGAGLVIAAVGAILVFGVHVTNSHGFNLHTIGFILIVVGILGVILDLALFMPRRRTTYVRGGTRVTRIDDDL